MLPTTSCLRELKKQVSPTTPTRSGFYITVHQECSTAVATEPRTCHPAKFARWHFLQTPLKRSCSPVDSVKSFGFVFVENRINTHDKMQAFILQAQQQEWERSLTVSPLRSFEIMQRRGKLKQCQRASNWITMTLPFKKTGC